MRVKLRAEKMVQAVDTITFMDHHIGKVELGINPEKVSVICRCEGTPKCERTKRIQINYITKFMPNLASA